MATIVYITHKPTKFTKLVVIPHDDAEAAICDALTLLYDDDATSIAEELRTTADDNRFESIEYKAEYHLVEKLEQVVTRIPM